MNLTYRLDVVHVPEAILFPDTSIDVPLNKLVKLVVVVIHWITVDEEVNKAVAGYGGGDCDGCHGILPLWGTPVSPCC